MDSGSDASLLRSSIFEGIPQGTIEDLCSRGRVLSFDENDKLFERGDEATELMILREGVVELLLPVQIMGVTREVAMERKQAGDLVAWSAIVSPYHFMLSARCASRCTLAAFGRDALRVFFEANQDAGYAFMCNLAGVISRRLNAMQTMWMHDLQASAERRLG